MHASLDTLPRPGTTRAARPNAILDADAMLSIWTRQRDLVDQRVAAIECATDALVKGRLEDSDRQQAQRAAHMLAGSIGMFGFHEAARAARELERALSHPTGRDAPKIAALLVRIRDDLG